MTPTLWAVAGVGALLVLDLVVNTFVVRQHRKLQAQLTNVQAQLAAQLQAAIGQQAFNLVVTERLDSHAGFWRQHKERLDLNATTLQQHGRSIDDLTAMLAQAQLDIERLDVEKVTTSPGVGHIEYTARLCPAIIKPGNPPGRCGIACKTPSGYCSIHEAPTEVIRDE